MKHSETISLKDGSVCVIRNGTEQDGKALLDIFILTHQQSDFLASYPDEKTMTAEQEGAYLMEKSQSANEIELLAEIDGKVVGSAGICCVRNREKLRHRAEFGISVDKQYWGIGIGRALTEACIRCAKAAGYAQLELEVVSDNSKAISLYKSVGFTEYGRNPKGFLSRSGVWQELVLMRLEL